MVAKLYSLQIRLVNNSGVVELVATLYDHSVIYGIGKMREILEAMAIFKFLQLFVCVS